MKTKIALSALLLSAASLNGLAQTDEQKEKQQSERSRSMQGIRTDNELKDDRQQVQSNEFRNSGKDSLSNQNPADSAQTEVIQKNQDQGLGADDDGNGLTNENNKTQSGEEHTNTPAVIQRTTSESGSPAILSGEDGKKRDGTNNVQRATPNIAGAEEIGGTDLDKKNRGEKNANTGAPRVRKQEEQPAVSRPQTESSDTTNIIQEQQNPSTLASEEAAMPLTAKDKRKAKREARRNRRNN